ncbi:MAG TPA: tetratricopeptide repeat protein [Tenuifilaceae bacterium]|nr:tetratricopeptide repeat protein [Tenuifilaceae bacterium]HOZ14532.1 tetratricopeptide repeat protein [Tenuifilaceae bacterium]HPI45382.1 tetratricopeptide repeat protein [Tenuifilaceae bacterium]HPN22049.1 tetratricopeptide repeat protein [Tenuifilaceae bacterium]
MNHKKIFLLIVLLGIAALANSQEVDAVASQSNPQRVKADSLLNKLQFTQALSIYDELIKEYPRDPNIQYPLGICYLMGTRNVDKAIEYLTKASIANVPNMVYFFLAEALRQNYQFNEAIDYYRRFTISGGSRDIKVKDVEPLVTLCENGSFLTRYIFTPQVLDTKSLSVKDFYNYYSVAPSTGSFTSIPENLLTPTDKKLNHQSVMFYPKNPQVGDYVYYSSYGNSTSFGKDIFRIKFQDDGYWSKPEVIGDVVNSFFDDDFPYMAPDGVTLYFSSKGHYGMGGYDIYKSVYNPKTRLWSTAENLGFPYNSPFDDFLYVVGDADSLVCFATNRNFMPDTVQLVLMKNEENPIRRSAKSNKELVSLARLNMEGASLVVEQKRVEVKKNVEEKKVDDLKKKKPATFSSVENDPEYARVIAKGFAAQMLTDSLITRLEKLRQGFDYIDTAEERIKLEKKVTKVEDEMLAAQKEADMMFVRASQIEQEYLTGKRKPQGKADATFAVDNPDYIYQAQFATTVFQDDEINRLALVEQIYPQLVKTRENAFAAKDKYRACTSNSSDTAPAACIAETKVMLSAMGSYSSLMEKYFEKKYTIYNDCLHVALVKSGTKDETIRNDINASKAHIRTASAIMNNLGEEGKVESTFEASLMRELALLKLDLAFSKIWGLKLFEQQLTSRIIKLETNIFGTSQQAEPVKEVAQKQEVIQVVPEGPKIEKQEEVMPVQTIAIKQEIPSDFGVVEKPVYNAENPIPIDSPLPDGVVYRIQIGAFSTLREPQFFKGMVPVFGEKAGTLTKYFIGNLTTYSSAEKALGVVKSKGFKDAFIIAWYNGKKITPQRAQSLEGTAVPVAKSTEVDNGRIYKIQVGVYENELPDDVAKTIRTIASGKEISRTDNGLGQKEFSVGNYSTLDEAQRVKDNLIASGIVNAVVITIELDKK